LISKDKLSSLPTNSLTIQLLKTSEAELITKGEDLKPFWDGYSQVISKRLWCTQKTDSVDSAQTFLKKSVTTSIPNSQLFQVGLQQTQTMNSQKTSFLSLRYSPQDSMGKENIKRKSKKKEQLNESIAPTPDNNTTKYTKVSRTI